jgi:predicted secreted acid phosphatase
MNRSWCQALFAAAVLVAAGGAEPRNLDLLKAEIRDYFKSGEYQKEVAAVAGKADAWLVERAAKRTAAERLVVVFDLDETLLSNWPHIASLDLGYTRDTWDAWVAAGKAPPIEAVRDVYRTARRLKIEVVFITGRREHQRAATEKNLREVGCGEFLELVMKPDDYKGTAAAYKTAARASVIARGCAIVANVGDQESDLVGGNAEKTFKLPNPLYLSP